MSVTENHLLDNATAVAQAAGKSIGVSQQENMRGYQQDRFMIAEANTQDAVLMKQQISTQFARTNSEINSSEDINSNRGGSCANLVVIGHDRIDAAQLGDSRAVLFMRDKATGAVYAYPLNSSLHGVENPKEWERIEKQKAEWQKIDPDVSIGKQRNYLTLGRKGLAITRSFGDNDFTLERDGKSPISLVSKEPEIESWELAHHDKYDYFVGVGCDGMFDKTSPEQYAGLVQQHAGLTPGEIAEKMVDLALSTGAYDNLTMLFSPVPDDKEKTIVLAVCDGHGRDGEEIAEKAASELQRGLGKAIVPQKIQSKADIAYGNEDPYPTVLVKTLAPDEALHKPTKNLEQFKAAIEEHLPKLSIETDRGVCNFRPVIMNGVALYQAGTEDMMNLVGSEYNDLFFSTPGHVHGNAGILQAFADPGELLEKYYNQNKGSLAKGSIIEDLPKIEFDDGRALEAKFYEEGEALYRVIASVKDIAAHNNATIDGKEKQFLPYGTSLDPDKERVDAPIRSVVREVLRQEKLAAIGTDAPDEKTAKEQLAPLRKTTGNKMAVMYLQGEETSKLAETVLAMNVLGLSPRIRTYEKENEPVISLAVEGNANLAKIRSLPTLNKGHTPS